MAGKIPVTTMDHRTRGNGRRQSGAPSCASPTCDSDTRTSEGRRTDPLRPDASWPPTPTTTTSPTPAGPLRPPPIIYGWPTASRAPTASLRERDTRPLTRPPIRTTGSHGRREDTDPHPRNAQRNRQNHADPPKTNPHLTRPFHISCRPGSAPTAQLGDSCADLGRGPSRQAARPS